MLAECGERRPALGNFNSPAVTHGPLPLPGESEQNSALTPPPPPSQPSLTPHRWAPVLASASSSTTTSSP
ncbi:hypothetical protein BO86DRAFT_91324 [Aspergillus japonicus CBS 114.51]|uniref:Uncharacterized protein n=1 Tax=Aspergillus japonicus CBS 114.51 TaxID=1448312 RepID=A0A8T8X1R9_ASPJA|nr:hypothetical protein BO86DRAFT_91324 [Aspergillus japonicus CBS 114.51]RAH81971.1 hypothetical protein BO86DRAFT_91324 [Aspergillus japonicus CBS 114.51]